MNNIMAIGAEARRQIAAILAKGILTLERSAKERQIDDNQLAMPENDDNDSAVSNQGGKKHE